MKRTHGQRRKHRRQSRRWLAWLGAGALLLVVAIALARRPGVPVPGASEGPSVYSGSEDAGRPYPDVPRIEPEAAKVAYDARSALFVDVRAYGEYQSEHIPGALSIPLDQPWWQGITENASTRRQIVHHDPGYLDDERDLDSVEPSDVTSPESVADFLNAAQALFTLVFAAYGTDVPVTHSPPQ